MSSADNVPRVLSVKPLESPIHQQMQTYVSTSISYGATHIRLVSRVTGIKCHKSLTQHKTITL